LWCASCGYTQPHYVFRMPPPIQSGRAVRRVCDGCCFCVRPHRFSPLVPPQDHSLASSPPRMSSPWSGPSCSGSSASPRVRGHWVGVGRGGHWFHVAVAALRFLNLSSLFSLPTTCEIPSVCGARKSRIWLSVETGASRYSFCVVRDSLTLAKHTTCVAPHFWFDMSLATL
jgi:hypothetical protein